MIELSGQIRHVKLTGSLNAIPGGHGGDCKHQEKTVFPTAEQQIVVPDDGFKGLSSVKVEALPVAENNYFGTGSTEDVYSIQGATVESIAVAIQNKKNTTAILTPAQMAVEIENIDVGDNLPDAEATTFGVVSNTEENAILCTLTFAKNAYTSNNTGFKFTPNENISFCGFLVCGVAGGKTLTCALWDGDTREKITELKVAPAAREWRYYALADPVNLLMGKSYVVSVWLDSTGFAYCSCDGLVYNKKITPNGFYHSNGGGYRFPDYGTTVTNTTVPGINFVIGPPLIESTVTEYKIQTTTLDAIAAEVQRIIGGTNKMTPESMAAALAGVAAQTTE